MFLSRVHASDGLSEKYLAIVSSSLSDMDSLDSNTLIDTEALVLVCSDLLARGKASVCLLGDAFRLLAHRQIDDSATCCHTELASLFTMALTAKLPKSSCHVMLHGLTSVLLSGGSPLPVILDGLCSSVSCSCATAALPYLRPSFGFKGFSFEVLCLAVHLSLLLRTGERAPDGGELWVTLAETCRLLSPEPLVYMLARLVSALFEPQYLLRHPLYESLTNILLPWVSFGFLAPLGAPSDTLSTQRPVSISTSVDHLSDDSALSTKEDAGSDVGHQLHLLAIAQCILSELLQKESLISYVCIDHVRPFVWDLLTNVASLALSSAYAYRKLFQPLFSLLQALTLHEDAIALPCAAAAAPARAAGPRDVPYTSWPFHLLNFLILPALMRTHPLSFNLTDFERLVPSSSFITATASYLTSSAAPRPESLYLNTHLQTSAFFVSLGKAAPAEAAVGEQATLLALAGLGALLRGSEYYLREVLRHTFLPTSPLLLHRLLHLAVSLARSDRKPVARAASAVLVSFAGRVTSDLAACRASFSHAKSRLLGRYEALGRVSMLLEDLGAVKPGRVQPVLADHAAGKVADDAHIDRVLRSPADDGAVDGPAHLGLLLAALEGAADAGVPCVHLAAAEHSTFASTAQLAESGASPLAIDVYFRTLLEDSFALRALGVLHVASEADLFRRCMQPFLLSGEGQAVERAISSIGRAVAQFAERHGGALMQDSSVLTLVLCSLIMVNTETLSGKINVKNRMTLGSFLNVLLTAEPIKRLIERANQQDYEVGRKIARLSPRPALPVREAAGMQQTLASLRRERDALPTKENMAAKLTGMYESVRKRPFLIARSIYDPVRQAESIPLDSDVAYSSLACASEGAAAALVTRAMGPQARASTVPGQLSDWVYGTINADFGSHLLLTRVLLHDCGALLTPDADASPYDVATMFFVSFPILLSFTLESLATSVVVSEMLSAMQLLKTMHASYTKVVTVLAAASPPPYLGTTYDIVEHYKKYLSIVLRAIPDYSEQLSTPLIQQTSDPSAWVQAVQTFCATPRPQCLSNVFLLLFGSFTKTCTLFEASGSGALRDSSAQENAGKAVACPPPTSKDAALWDDMWRVCARVLCLLDMYGRFPGAAPLLPPIFEHVTSGRTDQSVLSAAYASPPSSASSLVPGRIGAPASFLESMPDKASSSLLLFTLQAMMQYLAALHESLDSSSKAPSAPQSQLSFEVHNNRDLVRLLFRRMTRDAVDRTGVVVYNVTEKHSEAYTHVSLYSCLRLLQTLVQTCSLDTLSMCAPELIIALGKLTGVYSKASGFANTVTSFYKGIGDQRFTPSTSSSLLQAVMRQASFTIYLSALQRILCCGAATSRARSDGGASSGSGDSPGGASAIRPQDLMLLVEAITSMPPAPSSRPADDLRFVTLQHYRMLRDVFAQDTSSVSAKEAQLLRDVRLRLSGMFIATIHARIEYAAYFGALFDYLRPRLLPSATEPGPTLLGFALGRISEGCVDAKALIGSVSCVTLIVCGERTDAETLRRVFIGDTSMKLPSLASLFLGTVTDYAINSAHAFKNADLPKNLSKQIAGFLLELNKDPASCAESGLSDAFSAETRRAAVQAFNLMFAAYKQADRDGGDVSCEGPLEGERATNVNTRTSNVARVTMHLCFVLCATLLADVACTCGGSPQMEAESQKNYLCVPYAGDGEFLASVRLSSGLAVQGSVDDFTLGLFIPFIAPLVGLVRTVFICPALSLLFCSIMGSFCESVLLALPLTERVQSLGFILQQICIPLVLARRQRQPEISPLLSTLFNAFTGLSKDVDDPKLRSCALGLARQCVLLLKANGADDAKLDTYVQRLVPSNSE